MKVIILGGGASGLMAALSAARDARNTVTILERQSRVGRKLLATGNGRCNLANLQLSPARYHGQDPAFAQAALTRFGVQDTLEFFRGLGLLTVAEDSGRVYPLSDQANSVLDVLRFAAEQAGVQTVCGFDAQSVRKKARGYQLTAADGTGFFADRLIIACGGCAGKALGGTMAGYDLLGQLGHSRTPLHPSLTQIRTDPAPIRGLKGVRADCHIRLRAGGRTVQEDAGEPIPSRRSWRCSPRGKPPSRSCRPRTRWPGCSIRGWERRSAAPAGSGSSRWPGSRTRRWPRWRRRSRILPCRSPASPDLRAHR